MPATATSDVLSDPEARELAVAYEMLKFAPYHLPTPSGAKADTRLEDARALVLAGRVQYDDATAQWLVQGKEQAYILTESCPCPQGALKRLWCKHMIARKLWCEWQWRLGHVVPPVPGAQRVPQATTVTPATAPVFEDDAPTPDLTPVHVQVTAFGNQIVRDTTAHPHTQEAAMAVVDTLTGEILPDGDAVSEAFDEEHTDSPPVAAQEAARSDDTPQSSPQSHPQPKAILGHPESNNGHAAPRPTPGLPPLSAILARLAQPLPKECLGVKMQGGAQLTFVPHYVVASLLDAVAPGWQTEVTRFEQSQGVVRLFLRLGLPCAEGMVWREDVGESDDWETDPKQYGNPSANAKASALRRVAAQFGVGRWLYDKSGHLAALARHLAAPTSAPTPSTPPPTPREAIAALLLRLGVPKTKEACQAYVTEMVGVPLLESHYQEILRVLTRVAAQKGV
jgi:hypothetical protein